MKIKAIVDTIRHEADLLKGEGTVNKTYCSQNTFPDEPTALNAFALAKERLFDVNRWSELSRVTADFILHDQAGHPKQNGWPAVGDYINVQLPGPTPENWVRVTRVDVDEKRAGFTARPCADPHDKKDRIEHFFTDESTSTFRVEVAGNTITACQIGQNESINNREPQAGDRAVVNTLIAETGWLFYQKIQWKTFTDYVVNG